MCSTCLFNSVAFVCASIISIIVLHMCIDVYVCADSAGKEFYESTITCVFTCANSFFHLVFFCACACRLLGVSMLTSFSLSIFMRHRPGGVVHSDTTLHSNPSTEIQADRRRGTARLKFIFFKVGGDHDGRVFYAKLIYLHNNDVVARSEKNVYTRTRARASFMALHAKGVQKERERERARTDRDDRRGRPSTNLSSRQTNNMLSHPA